MTVQQMAIACPSLHIIADIDVVGQINNNNNNNNNQNINNNSSVTVTEYNDDDYLSPTWTK